MYLADDTTPTVPASTAQLAKAWLIVLGATIGIGLVMGQLAGGKTRRR
jgi:hypothetical protein